VKRPFPSSFFHCSFCSLIPGCFIFLIWLYPSNLNE
jgi:hypothetical protein